MNLVLKHEVYVAGKLHTNVKIAKVPIIRDNFALGQPRKIIDGEFFDITIYDAAIDLTWPFRLPKGTLLVAKSPAYFNEPTILIATYDSSLVPGRYVLSCDQVPIYKQGTEMWFKHQVLIANYKKAKESQNDGSDNRGQIYRQTRTLSDGDHLER